MELEGILNMNVPYSIKLPKKLLPKDDKSIFLRQILEKYSELVDLYAKSEYGTYCLLLPIYLRHRLEKHHFAEVCRFLLFLDYLESIGYINIKLKKKEVETLK